MIIVVRCIFPARASFTEIETSPEMQHGALCLYYRLRHLTGKDSLLTQGFGFLGSRPKKPHQLTSDIYEGPTLTRIPLGLYICIQLYLDTRGLL